MTERAITSEKKRRKGYEVLQRDGDRYELRDPASGETLRLTLYFYDLGRLPDKRDILYFPDDPGKGLKDGLYSYQFSAAIGKACARPPHDFLAEPREFLILEYAHGDTILLEEQYG